MKTIRDFFPTARTMKTSTGAARRLAVLRGLNLIGATADVVKVGDKQYLAVVHLVGEALMYATALANAGVCVSNQDGVLEILRGPAKSGPQFGGAS